MGMTACVPRLTAQRESKMRIFVVATSLMAFCLLAGTPLVTTWASAQTQRATPKRVIDACMNDVFKFCSNVMMERTKLEQCLREHRDQLTPACRAMEPKR
jgi:hypothetical protein